MSKQFWAVIVVIILVFVGAITLTGHKSNKSSGSNSSGSSATNHVEGNGKSGVTLVEYGDYECPYCEEYSSTVNQVVTEFNDQIHFQFRNFPLTSIHPNAFAAARAAEAASLQNKFWQMHDLLYETANWQVWSTSSDPTPYFWQYASQLGLNVPQFKSDFASSEVNDAIQADMDAGNKLNVQGTPTFFLDGKEVQVGNSVSAFEKVINAEIAKKQPAAH